MARVNVGITTIHLSRTVLVPHQCPVRVHNPEYQRGLAEEEDVTSRKAIVDQGCEIAELTAEEHAQFAKAVQPLWTDAQKMYGKEMFAMVPR